MARFLLRGKKQTACHRVRAEQWQIRRRHLAPLHLLRLVTSADIEVLEGPARDRLERLDVILPVDEFPDETGELPLVRRFVSRMLTRRSASGKGSGLIRTESMALKTAVFAPMPSASVTIATAVNPGVRLKDVTA
jgi:hypothetical protein